MNKFFDSVMNGLKKAVEDEKSMNSFAANCGVNQSTIWRWIKGTRKPKFLELSEVLDSLGAQVFFPWDSLPSMETEDPIAIKHERDALRLKVTTLELENAQLNASVRALQGKDPLDRG